MLRGHSLGGLLAFALVIVALGLPANTAEAAPASGWNEPLGVAIDPKSGHVLVSDVAADAVLEFKQSGAFVRRLVPEPQYGFSAPSGLAFDSVGRLFVTEVLTSRIEVFSSSRMFLRSIPEGGNSGDSPGELSSVRDVAVRSNGNLLALDAGNNRVQEFTAEGEYVSMFGSYGSQLSQLSYPGGVEVSGAGEIYVADTGNDRVAVYSSSGIFERMLGTFGAGPGEFFAPGDLRFTADGHLYVLDTFNRRIQEFGPDDEFLMQMRRVPGHGEFEEPRGIAVADDDSLFVADRDRQRVFHLDPTGHFLGELVPPGGAIEDVQPPRVQALVPRRLVTKRRRAHVKVRFKAFEPSTFTCQLDENVVKPCRSPKTYTLSVGGHRIRITATDDSGNTTSRLRHVRVIRERRGDTGR